MTPRQINIQRLSVISVRPFDSVAAVVNAAVGHPDLSELAKKVAAAKTYCELESAIQPGLGKYGLMEFTRFDLGLILQKALGPGAPKILRLLVGNPLIMQAMARHVPDAGSYAPVTILIDERPDGVHLSYDSMASLLAPYENAEASQVARDLDAKVSQLLSEAAGS